MDPDQKFMAYIDKWAADRHCTFEVETFDGRESPELIDGMAVDDVWGWLIPLNTKEKNDTNYGCVEWETINGHLILKWNIYNT